MHSTLLLGAMMAIGAAAVPNPALKVIDVYTTVTRTLLPGETAPTAAPQAPAAVPAPAKPAAGLGFLQKPQPAPPSTNSSSGGHEDMMAVVNKYRALYKQPPLTYDPSMDSNCAQVGEAGHGVLENHILIPNTNMGQVICPGSNDPNDGLDGFSPFELAYLALLCEVHDPELGPAMNNGQDLCAIAQQALHMEYNGETGHNKIMTTSTWRTFSAVFTSSGASGTYKGLWVMDYGM